MKKIITLFILSISIISLTSCKKLTVSFVDENEQLIEEIKVKKGTSIELIEIPENKKDLYIWDKTNDDLKKIESDTKVKLIAKEFTVSFVDEEQNIISQVKVKANESTELIDLPEANEGFYYKWDKTNDDLKNIKSDITVNRKYLEYNKICQYYIDEQLIQSNTVKYSTNIVAPDIPEKYVNGRWEENKTFENNMYVYKYTLQYDSVSYSITYFVNGEEVELETNLFTGLEDVILPEYELNGYIFNGWYPGEISLYRYKVIPAGTKHDVTLYARMTKIPEKIELPEASYHFETIVSKPHSSNPNLTVFQPKIPTDAPSASVQQYDWSTSDSSIATVSQWSSITAKKAGYCVLIAKYKSDPSIIINCLMKVTSDGVEYVTPEDVNTNIYTVTFVDKNGEIIETQKVLSNQSAIAPIPPVYEGLAFNGWNKPITNITEDTTIQATYIEGNNKYTGKKFAFIGDSISTYQDYILDGYDCFYPYPTADVNDVNFTWWMQVVNKLGAGLFVNNSYSGSCVSTTNSSATQNDSRLATTVFGEEKPDVIVIYMGSNDCASMYVDLQGFGPAYEKMLQKLQALCPEAEIVVCTLAKTIFYSASDQAAYNEKIIDAAEKYNATLLDLSSADISDHLVDSAHPKTSGMTIIANKVIEELLK